MKKIMILFLCVVLLSVSFGCLGESEIQSVEERSQDDSEVPYETQPEPEPAQKGTYQNPANMDETITITSLGDTFRFSVDDVIRGQQANSMALGANMFNDEPSSGYEYAFVKVEVNFRDGESSKYMSTFDFKGYSQGVELTSPFLVFPDQLKEFSSGNVMPGATKDGWIVFTVPQNEEVIISYYPNLLSSNGGYISIGN
ncbi:DUF4352 domain-containing protein [Methanosalsum natronophilum]|uniref:DUF4352 domain-containing protein n=1 Tax=Methanosalsum natronophilum TaxID=768733 RepID=UPI0021678D8E|nr:DUF4352 domain-containing protein [Methanosalsum natronophilum]MCS3924914.1 hypothetical protein [Methanosalsum natronophilum]